MSAAEASDNRLVELSSDQCWELLSTRPFGRIAWTGSDGLNVVPVNYVLDDRRILMQTAPYTTLARECRDRDVAFQVDDIDVESRTGWSVLVRGRCHDTEPLADEPVPEVWPSGSRRAPLVIEVREVTGRRLGS